MQEDLEETHHIVQEQNLAYKASLCTDQAKVYKQELSTLDKPCMTLTC